MRISSYAYNPIGTRYFSPIFSSEPVQVDWDSESGQVIEKTLWAMVEAEAAAHQVKALDAEDAPVVFLDDNGDIVEQPSKI